MKPPVLFLSFANDQGAHLPLLDEERKAITEQLTPLASEQHFQLHTESSATISDISNYLSEFRERLLVFHYGGHADSDRILLQGQEAHADGLAEALALQKNLKLVFLNGCSTREQVALLLQLGVPAVIATSVPIGDRAARTFSEVFYRSLASQHSLEEAFKLAAANHLMASGKAAGIYRGIRLRREEEAVELPWGLYVAEGKDDVLSWKLPRESTSSFIIRGAGRKYQAGVSMNKELVIAIANAIAEYSFPIKMMVEEAKRKGREPKLRNLRAAVIDSFPTPIGTHLRKLVISEDISTDRLRKIINVYSVSTQFLAFVKLAQLWDEKFRQPALQVPESQQNQLQAFFDLDDTALRTFNYLKIVRAAGDVFEVNNIEPFMEEFIELRAQFHSETKFSNAIFFLEEMKKELEGTIAADEIESFCVQAEEHLCTVFDFIGFTAKYTLATIKTIELLKERHADPNFRHNLVILNQLTAAIGVLDDVLVSAEFSDNNSVILMRDENTVQPCLNLSPFIIDENALAAQNNSKLFFYRYRTPGGVAYQLADNLKDMLIINEENYPFVKNQVEAFLRNVI